MNLRSAPLFGRYIPSDSLIHRIDPRCKLLCTLIVMVSVFGCSSLVSLLFCAVSVLVVVRLSKIHFSAVCKSTKSIFVIIVFTAILNILLTPGTAEIRFLIFKISPEGICSALRLTLRFFSAIVMGALLTFTTTPSELTSAFEDLLSPLSAIHVPVRAIAMMMTLAIRLIPMLFEEAETVINAQLSRGADFESGSLYKKTKAYAPVFIPLFIRVFRHADKMSDAMESRCYRVDAKRTRLHPLRWKKIDSGAIIVTVTMMIAIIFAGAMIK